MKRITFFAVALLLVVSTVQASELSTLLLESNLTSSEDSGLTPIPSVRLKEFTKAVQIAIDERGTSCHGGTRDFSNSAAIEDGQFYYKDIFSYVFSGSINQQGINPIIELTTRIPLIGTAPTKFQVMIISVSTKADLKTVTSYEFREYMSQLKTVNNGTLLNPILETVRVTDPTGAYCKG